MEYRLVETSERVWTVVDQNGTVVDKGFYDYDGSNDFWMKSGVYAELADILAYWNNK